MRISLILIACALGLAGPAALAREGGGPPESAACLPGIVAAERQFALPPKLLETIGRVESGRVDPASGRVMPWPWTINVAGTDRIFETKQAAVAAVRALQAAGTQSIDVGCLQVNLMYHPAAFASLDEAFDPAVNTQYGARFLSALYRETGNWPQAAAAYHSRTPELGARYETRVMALWPLAEKFPDPTLGLRGQAVPEDGLSRLTPAFAARVRAMRTDFSRLAAAAAPVVRPPVMLLAAPVPLHRAGEAVTAVRADGAVPRGQVRIVAGR